jgi:nicotinamide mononucleotide transporter PnuC
MIPFYILKGAELTATLLALLSTYYASSLNPLAWHCAVMVCLINGVLYAYLGIYGHAFLDLYYLAWCFFGYRYWKSWKKGDGIYSLNATQWVLTLAFILGLTPFIYNILDNLQGKHSIADSWSLSTGMVAFAAMSFQIREQWLLWGLHHIAKLFLTIQAGLYFQMAKSVIQIALALWGLKSWDKLRKSSKKDRPIGSAALA